MQSVGRDTFKVYGVGNNPAKSDGGVSIAHCAGYRCQRPRTMNNTEAVTRFTKTHLAGVDVSLTRLVFNCLFAQSCYPARSSGTLRATEVWWRTRRKSDIC